MVELSCTHCQRRNGRSTMDEMRVCRSCKGTTDMKRNKRLAGPTDSPMTCFSRSFESSEKEGDVALLCVVKEAKLS